MTRSWARCALGTALAVSGLTLAVPTAEASRPGDGARFDTWTGYDVGRGATAVATGDFDGNGSTDVAWARDAFAGFDDPEFQNAVSVSYNLGDGTLSNARSFPAVSQSTDIAAADLDGDLDLDLAMSARDDCFCGDRVDLYLNDGSGNFTHTTAEGGEGPESIELGDADADGDVDIVLPNYWGYNPDDPDAGTVSVLLNNGDATFAPEVRYEVGSRQQDVRIGDVDVDGIVDLMAIRGGDDFQDGPIVVVHVLTGNGDGTFNEDDNPQTITLLGDCCFSTPTFRLGDLDGDGDLDAATGAIRYGNNAVFINHGAGNFQVDLFDLFGSQTVRLSDLDADSDLDLVSVGGGGGVLGSAYVQRNGGAGNLGAAEEIRTGNNPLGLDVGDIDGDGRLDLAVASRDTGTGVIHRQHADGTFAAPPAGTQFEPSVDVAPGDFDGDGDADVAASGQQDFVDVIRILQNDGTGDLSQLGVVRYDDAGSRLTRSVSAGDLDGDGDLDLAWLVNQYSFTRVVNALNNGNGSFATPTARAVPTCGENLLLADADGDGDLDQLVGNDQGCGGFDNGDAVSVGLNNGDATFVDGLVVHLTYNVRSVVVADVDGDGVLDIVGGGDGQGGGSDIGVALGVTPGAWANPDTLSTGTQHRELVGVDFNGDGDIDIASNTFDQGTTLLTNDGDGDFAVSHLEGENIPGYRNSVGIAAGDIDGDSTIDLVIANETGSNVGVHAGFGDDTFEQLQVRYGQRPRVTDVELADLNNDGVLDIISPAQLPAGGSPNDAGLDAPTPGGSVTGSKSGGVSVLINRPAKCTISGTSGDDVLRGTRKTDVVCGLGGNDKLRGLGAGDILRGGPGNDRLIGADGVDVLDGGSGDDKLKGGDHSDSLRGGAGSDKLVGGAGQDTIDALDKVKGNDTGAGNAGKDHCRADEGDTLKRCP